MLADSTDRYEILSGPTGTLVTLADFKAFAKIDTDADDVIIQQFIDAAIADLEKYTNSFFIERDVRGHFTRLRTSQYEAYPYVQLGRAPFIDVDAVTVWNGTAFAAFAAHVVKPTDTFARVWFTDFLSVTDISEAYPVRVDFSAGYGAAGVVPDAIKVAVMMYANYLYGNRGDCDCSDVSAVCAASGAKALLARYTFRRTFA